MQLGTENRNKTIAAVVLAVLAVVLTVMRFLPDSPASAKSPSPGVTAQVVAIDNRPAVKIHRTGSGKKPGVSPPRSLDPTLRYDWLKASEDTKYQGAGRNIFRAQYISLSRSSGAHRGSCSSPRTAATAAHQS